MTCNRILVVDDDPMIRQFLQLVCKEEGYTVASAIDGEEALVFLCEHKEPWLVLLDIMMPRMNGLEVCARLAASEAIGARHVVVLMTAGTIPEGGLPVPAHMVLYKPFELANLLRCLAHLTETMANLQGECGTSDNSNEIATCSGPGFIARRAA